MNSIKQNITQQIERMEPGQVFLIKDLSFNCNKNYIEKILSSLIKSGIVNRAYRSVYYKCEYSEILKRNIPPYDYDVIIKIAEKNNEILQYHGGCAANRLHLSTQVPLNLVFWTNGYSREIFINGVRVTLYHTDNKKLLQHNLTNVGLAISALYYFGKEIVDFKMMKRLKNSLKDLEFEMLVNSNLENWMHKVIQDFKKQE